MFGTRKPKTLIFQTEGQEERIIFPKMPMPPSVNKQYWARGMYLNGKVVGRIIRTKELIQYQEVDFKKWELENKQSIDLARKKMLEWAERKLAVCVDTYVCFPRSAIWTKKDTVKTIDTKNRMKAVHDCLAKAIGVDDKIFWCGFDEKLQTDNEEPWCMIVLSPWKPRKIEDIKLQDL